MNITQLGDQHLELRVRELARRLHRPVAAVRPETVRERRERADGVECGQRLITRTRR
jgi:hypothetical protein